MKLLCISLGCDKNLVDAERMLGSLSQDGYTFTDDEQEADVILVNTCCFINDAKEESVNTILEMAEYKKSGTCKALLVSGCMAQRYKEEILQEVPEVDGILGTTSYDEVSKVLAKALKGERVPDPDIRLPVCPLLQSMQTRPSGQIPSHRRTASVPHDPPVSHPGNRKLRSCGVQYLGSLPADARSAPEAPPDSCGVPSA